MKPSVGPACSVQPSLDMATWDSGTHFRNGSALHKGKVVLSVDRTEDVGNVYAEPPPA